MKRLSYTELVEQMVAAREGITVLNRRIAVLTEEIEEARKEILRLRGRLLNETKP